MKLLIILSVEEHANEVRRILARQKVPIYSETRVHGFRTEAYQPDIANWFAQDDFGIYSTLFFSFQDETAVRRVLDEVRTYNESKNTDTTNPLHAYCLQVDRAV